MKYDFKNSFVRSIKALPNNDKQKIKELSFELIDLLSSGKKPPKGYGLTRLRKDYWEARLCEVQENLKTILKNN